MARAAHVTPRVVDALIDTARRLAAQNPNLTDGKGFNNSDVEFGRRLATLVEIRPAEDTRERRLLANLVVVKYHRQAAEFLSADDVASLHEIAKPEPISLDDREHSRRTVSLLKVGGEYLFGFQQNKALVEAALQVGAVKRKTDGGLMFAINGGGAQKLAENMRRLGVEIVSKPGLLIESKPAPKRPQRNDLPMEANAILAWREGDNITMKLPLNEEYVGVIRSIPGRLWNGTRKVWSIPIRHAATASTRFRALGANTRAIEDLAPAGGDRPCDLSVTIVGDVVELGFEYDAILVARIRALDRAEYQGKSRTWAIPVIVLRAFENLLDKHPIPYDRSDLDAALRNVEARPNPKVVAV